jgi:hypothetical protein
LPTLESLGVRSDFDGTVVLHAWLGKEPDPARCEALMERLRRLVAHWAERGGFARNGGRVRRLVVAEHNRAARTAAREDVSKDSPGAPSFPAASNPCAVTPEDLNAEVVVPALSAAGSEETSFVKVNATTTMAPGEGAPKRNFFTILDIVDSIPESWGSRIPSGGADGTMLSDPAKWTPVRLSVTLDSSDEAAATETCAAAGACDAKGAACDASCAEHERRATAAQAHFPKGAPRRTLRAFAGAFLLAHDVYLPGAVEQLVDAFSDPRNNVLITNEIYDDSALARTMGRSKR